MDPVLQLNSQASDQDWVERLQQFYDANVTNHKYETLYGLEKKKQFISHVFQKLKSTDNVDIKGLGLAGVRLCCREQGGLDQLTEKENFQLLLELSHLQDIVRDSSSFQKQDEHVDEGLEQANSLLKFKATTIQEYEVAEAKLREAVDKWKLTKVPIQGELSISWGDPKAVNVAVEAAKCAVNICMRVPAAERKLFELISIPTLLQLIKSSDTPRTLWFPFGRILCTFAIKPENREVLFSCCALQTSVEILEECIENIENLEYQLSAIEALKVVLSLTMKYGPLDGTPSKLNMNDLSVLKRLAKVYQTLIFLPDGSYCPNLKPSVVSCLINFPVQCTAFYDQKKMLMALLQFLEFKLRENVDVESQLTPVLMVLSQIAEAYPNVRSLIKEFLFAGIPANAEPDGVAPPKEVVNSNCVGKLLFPFLMSVNLPLRHYATDLVYTSCNRSADEFVRLAGFGNTAGFLHSHNLLGAFGGMLSGKAKNVKTTKRDIKDEDPLPEMTEEKAKELCELMDKLEKKGLLKVVRKKDGES